MHAGCPRSLSCHRSFGYFCFHFISFYFMFINFREGGNERSINVRERNTDQVSHLLCTPTRGGTCKPGMCPGREWNPTFWCAGRCSRRLSHLARAMPPFLIYTSSPWEYSVLKRRFVARGCIKLSFPNFLSIF